MTARRRWPSVASVLVFITGLVSAVAAGVATYRELGLYGGPILTGFHREWDPQTGRSQLVHETTTKAGLRIRRLFTDYLSVERTIVSSADAPKTQTVAEDKGRIAFSTRDDGVIDAWATRDLKAETARVAVSTKRDGRIDRWEQYVKGQLVRVDLDTDGNGKADRWMTYEEGILMDTFIDADEDGQPDDHRR